MGDSPIILSYGGGVQTVGIVALSLAGHLPRPERIVFADTGREAATTMEYAQAVVSPRLEAAGFPPIEIAGHDLAFADIWPKNDKGVPLLPMYSSCGGRLPTFCSGEWKRDVIRRYLRSKGYRRVTLWMGISMDEVHRMKPAKAGWITHDWPLIEKKMKRHDVLTYLQMEGWPTPPRSSCWMCPHRSKADWAALSPTDLDKAVAFEKEIHVRRPDLFLSPTRRPLTEGFEDHPMDGCDGGFCFV